MILQKADQVNKNRNMYTEECLKKAVEEKLMANDAMDLFPEDTDIEEPKINQEQYGKTDYNEISNARKVMREAFDADEQFKWGYICNVAMHFYDELCEDGLELSYDRRNEIANKVLSILKYSSIKEEMVDNAYKELKNISWDNRAVKINNIYNSVSNL